MSDEHLETENEAPTDARYRFWRPIHITSSALVALVSILHCTLTFIIYDDWSPDTVWFLGTGLGLLLLASSNLTHIGIQPCRQPTAPLVRWANWVFVVFGLGALFAVPEPQAIVLFVGIIGQAIAGTWTLRGYTA